jgi:TatA/E family protein of Tat protein translocase
MGLKMSEILLILAALLLLFGASRLPQLGTSLGSAIRNFKKGFGGEDDKPSPPGNATGDGKLAQGGGAVSTDSDKTAAKQG